MAFELPDNDLQLSLFRVQGLDESSIWTLGLVYAAQGRTLYARGQLTVSQATPPPLTIRPDEPPPRHSVVTGWPLAKNERVSLYQRLAADATLFVRPR